MNSLLKSLKSFDDYINGGSSEDLAKQFDFYENNHKRLKRDFHKMKIGDDPRIREKINCILHDLNIPQSKWGKYSSSLTVYDFLLILAQQGHPQIHYIIEKIDNKTRIFRLEMVLRYSVLLPFFSILFSIPAFQIGFSIFKDFVTSVSVPVMGLFFSSCASSYRFYTTYNNKTQSKFNRWRDNVFLLAGVPLNFLAYGLLLFGSTVLSPLIAFLFVAVSGIRVLKEIFCLVQEIIIYKYRPELYGDDWQIKHKAYARRKFDYQQRLIAVGINLIAAFLVVGIMTAACFIPGGFAVTVVTLSLMASIYLVQITFLKLNELWLRDRLQKQLHKIDETAFSYRIQKENEEISEIAYHPLPEMKAQPSPNIIEENEIEIEKPQKINKTASASELPFFKPKEKSRRFKTLSSKHKFNFEAFISNQLDPGPEKDGSYCIS